MTIRHFENRRGEGPGDEVEAFKTGEQETGKTERDYRWS